MTPQERRSVLEELLEKVRRNAAQPRGGAIAQPLAPTPVATASQTAAAARPHITSHLVTRTPLKAPIPREEPVATPETRRMGSSGLPDVSAHDDLYTDEDEDTKVRQVHADPPAAAAKPRDVPTAPPPTQPGIADETTLDATTADSADAAPLLETNEIEIDFDDDEIVDETTEAGEPPPAAPDRLASAVAGAKAAAERAAAERLEAQRAEAERAEQARRDAEKREEARREAERLEAERKEAERIEAERIEAQRKEAERIEAERKEAERIEAERIEAQRKEAERIEAERIETERLEAQRKEAERIETERIEAERLEAQRKEAERVEAERKEAERIEAERVEAERLEAERKELARIEEERADAAPISTRQKVDELRPTDAFLELEDEEQPPESGEVASQRQPATGEIVAPPPSSDWIDEDTGVHPIESRGPEPSGVIVAGPEVITRRTTQGDPTHWLGARATPRPATFGDLLDASIALDGGD